MEPSGESFDPPAGSDTQGPTVSEPVRRLIIVVLVIGAIFLLSPRVPLLVWLVLGLAYKFYRKKLPTNLPSGVPSPPGALPRRTLQPKRTWPLIVIAVVAAIVITPFVFLASQTASDGSVSDGGGVMFLLMMYAIGPILAVIALVVIVIKIVQYVAGWD